MAFQFVPPFEEGDKQTNNETGVEYIFTDGAWRPLGPNFEDQYDKLDERYVKTEGNSDFKGDLYLKPPTSGISRFRVLEANTPHRFEITSHPKIGGQLTNSKIHIAVKNEPDVDGNDNPETIINWVRDPVQPHQAVNKAYVDNNALTGDFLPITGGTLDGTLSFQRGSKDTPQFKITPNKDDNYATNIYSLNNSQMRLRTSSGTDESPYETHIILDANNGSAETKIYKVTTPTKDDMAANKQYVDDHRAIARNGTETNPTLSTGMLYYNTTTKQLFIGE
jgi:hypothetical protein